jgi:hypothetical protein
VTLPSAPDGQSFQDSKAAVSFGYGRVQVGGRGWVLEVRRRPNPTESGASMTMNWILLNIPLGAVMVAFTVGLPLWVMLKHPDGDDAAIAPTAAVTHEDSAARECSAVAA